MKKFFICAFMMALMAVSSVAFANDDMLKVTCAQYNATDLGGKTIMIVWIDGYLSAQSGNTEMTSEWMEQLSTYVTTQCAQNPNTTVMNVVNSME